MRTFLCMLCVAILAVLFPKTVSAEAATISPELSADELVSRMRTGWNLGNTFDAWGAPGSRLTGEIEDIETLWLGGRTNQTTQTLIQELRALGFDVLRIPVTWTKVADPENNHEIRADWMERVQEVVDWALAEDMFVILNMHHENVSLSLEIEDAHLSTHPGNIFVTNVWRQIAEHFRDYDERLIFASLNEPRHEGGTQEWWGATQTVRDNVNYLNQAFLDTVRATGGNNVYRIVQVPTVAAGATPNGMRDFVVPSDPMNPDVNKIVWSIHTYSPFAWAHDGRGVYDGYGEIVSSLDTVLNNAERLGLPVILGEWGSIHVSIGDDYNQELRNDQRPLHAEDYIREARERGMVAVWWDNGGFAGSDHTFGIVRRSYPHSVFDWHQQIINGIMRGVGAYEYIRETFFDEPEEEPTPYEPAVEIVETVQPEIIETAPETQENEGFGALFWAVIIGAFAIFIVFVGYRLFNRFA
ncbi:MAG: glycoside hydrolase family 5 protein [Defluviitaleaceae bacterium]|nr:glycoside hydrolase family 5 protein [Defluviitaleaceae bacterium]